jgi:glutathione S-transferase
MKLYVINTGCPYCVKAEFVLEAKRAAYEKIVVPTEDRSLVQQISGQGKVPVLVDDSHVVSDSTAIARYLEETIPEPALRPKQEDLAGLSDLLEDWSDEVFVGHVFDYAWEKYKPEDEGPPDYALMERALRQIEADMEMLCAVLRHRPFLVAESPCAADAAIWACLKLVRDGKLLDMKAAWTPVSDWLDRMDQRVPVRVDLSYIEKHRRRSL